VIGDLLLVAELRVRWSALIVIISIWITTFGIAITSLYLIDGLTSRLVIHLAEYLVGYVITVMNLVLHGISGKCAVPFAKRSFRNQHGIVVTLSISSRVDGVAAVFGGVGASHAVGVAVTTNSML
jgi:hypothetical protein